MGDRTRILHGMFAAALVGIFIWVIFALLSVRSQATTITMVDIADAPPVVSWVKLCLFPSTSDCSPVSTVVPRSGGVRDLDIYAQIVEAGGTGQLLMDATFGSLFRTAIGHGSCWGEDFRDGNYCVPRVACVTDSFVNPTTRIVKCTRARLPAWADPTTPAADDYAWDNWTVRVDTENNQDAMAYAEASFEVSEVVSLSLPGGIDYGTGSESRAPGYTSDINGTVDAVFMNTGNVDADAQIKADQSAMICTRGSIPAGNQKFYGGADVPYSSMTKKLTMEAKEMDLEDVINNGAIQRRNDEFSAPGQVVHFGIAIPTSNINGVCSGSVTISVVKESIPGPGQ